jgi:hypothetical protein
MTIENREVPTPSVPCRSPDRLAAPWMGLGLVAFDDRPFAKSLIKWYGPLFIASYCAFIGLANSQQWSWLGWWFDLWRPVVRWLKIFIPLFDNFASALVAVGFGHRVDTIQHLLAFCWIANSIMFAYLIWTTLQLTRVEWCRLVVAAPRVVWAGSFVISAIFFCSVVYWATVGFGLISNVTIYSFYRNDAVLIGIGINFYAITLFGVGVLLSLGAIIVGVKNDTV